MQRHGQPVLGNASVHQGQVHVQAGQEGLLLGEVVWIRPSWCPEGGPTSVGVGRIQGDAPVSDLGADQGRSNIRV